MKKYAITDNNGAFVTEVKFDKQLLDDTTIINTIVWGRTNPAPIDIIVLKDYYIAEQLSIFLFNCLRSELKKNNLSLSENNFTVVEIEYESHIKIVNNVV